MFDCLFFLCCFLFICCFETLLWIVVELLGFFLILHFHYYHLNYSCFILHLFLLSMLGPLFGVMQRFIWFAFSWGAVICVYPCFDNSGNRNEEIVVSITLELEMRKKCFSLLWKMNFNNDNRKKLPVILPNDVQIDYWAATRICS